MHHAQYDSTRRDFLKASAFAGLSIWGLSGPLLKHGLAQNAPDSVEKKPNTNGPAPSWINNSREHIKNTIMPAPEGIRLTDQIFLSKRAENVFYLDLGQRAVVIDSGYNHQVDHHLDNFQKLGCDLGKVVAILGTHFHVDHTGGVKRARERLSVPLIMHACSVEPLRTGDLLLTAAVIPEVDGWKFEYPPSPVDETVDEGDVIAVGEERIEVRHIPGHTPDSLGFVWRNHFFTGDAFFSSGAIGWSNPRWYSNYLDHAETLRRLVEHPPVAATFHASHGSDHPYDKTVMERCLKRLASFQQREDDPCNLTPRVKRRADDEPTRVLRFPA